MEIPHASILPSHAASYVTWQLSLVNYFLRTRKAGIQNDFRVEIRLDNYSKQKVNVNKLKSSPTKNNWELELATLVRKSYCCL